MTKTSLVPFLEQYRDLHTKWSITKESVLRVIDEFDCKLINELASDEKFTINKYFMDHRTSDEYIYDLLNGQLFEALICEWFIQGGSDATRDGSDKTGMIVRDNSKRITTRPDLIVDGKYIEIQVSRKGKLKQYDIKKNKGDRILRRENNLMFIVYNSYFIIDKDLLSKCDIKANPRWGGKLCYTVSDNIITYRDL